MTEHQLPSDSNSAAEPSMELVGGDATAAVTSGPSLAMKLVRGTLYGVVLLTATALLAISAVPELSRYATFGDTGDGASCAATGSACTTLDKVDFNSSCEDLQAVAATATGSPCCPLATSVESEGLLASGEAGSGSCCATISRTALLAASVDNPACCESSEACPAADAVATLDEPIDAGSLLATAADQPADVDSDDGNE